MPADGATSAVPGPPLGATAPAPIALEVCELGWSYPGRRALDGISMAVRQGEVFGVLGPNGSGKSTLFRVLSTLAPVQEGEVRVGGVDLRQRPAAARRRTASLFQQPALDLELTAAENLRVHGRLHGLSGRELRQRVPRLLERFGVADRAHERCRRLSGGLRRRVELAKALLPRPALLLLDEPSAGLDPAARRGLWDQIEHLQEEGVTVVLTTHLIEEAERCDRLVFLSHGRLVADGTPEELTGRIAGDAVVVRSADPRGLEAVLRRELAPQRLLVDGRGVRLAIPDGGRATALLDRHPDLVRSVTVGRPTLEDAFLFLTGEPLE